MSSIDIMLDDLKMHPKAKVTYIANPKCLNFEYKINRNKYVIKLSEIKRNGNKYIEFLKYVALSPEQRIIKNIIE